MKMIESRGKTLEEAIESGLNQLSLTREDVDITVLDEASKGFLGFGAKPARVLMTEKLRRVNRAEDEARQAREKQARDEENRRLNEERLRQQQEQRENEKREKAEQAALAEKAREQEKAERALRIEKARQEAAAQKKAPQRTQQPSAPAVSAENAEKSEKPAEQRPARSHQTRAQQPRSEQPQRQPRSRAVAKENLEDPDVPGVETEMSKEAKEYLDQLLKLMGVTIELSAVEKNNGLYITAAGPDAGTLIGYRGETLDALQYLVSLKVNKGEEDYHRVSLDAEDYRAKREDILIKLAHRLASKAVKTGRKVSLEPMNPYERRILHSALQGHPSVRTHSEGSDPYRRVVITPKSAASSAPRRQGAGQPRGNRAGNPPAPVVKADETAEQ